MTTRISLILLGLVGGLTLLTGAITTLPTNIQQIAAILLTVGLSLFCLLSERLDLPLALAYLPLGVRLNIAGDNLSLLVSFWLFDLICLKNLGLWARRREWDWRIRMRPSVGLLLSLFVAVIVISTALSINRGLSLRKLYDLAQYVAVFVAIVSTYRRNRILDLDLWLQALLLSGVGTALLGTLQFYSQFAWASPYLARDFYLQHTAALFEGTRSYDLLSDGLDNWVLINGPLRAFGSLLTPAGLGQYLLLGVIILVVYVPLRQLTGRVGAGLNWLLVWVAAELLVLAIFFTYARASWFVAVAVLLVAGFIWFRKRRSLRWPSRLKLLAGLAILVLPIGLNLVVFSLYHYKFTGEMGTGSLTKPVTPPSSSPNLPILGLAQPLLAVVPLQVSPSISSTVAPPFTPTPAVPLQYNPNFEQNQQQPLVRLLQIFNLSDHSTQDRFDAWKYGFRTFPTHPIFGRGPGTFGLGGLAEKDMFAPPDTITPAVEQASIQAHNIYLNFLVEDGIVGLLLYVGLISYTLYRLLLLRPHTTTTLATKLILIIWLAAFSWDEFFDNLFLYTKNGAILFVVLGLAAILISETSNPISNKANTSNQL